MSRLHTAGFESGIPGTGNYDGELNVATGVGHVMVGTVTYQTAVARNSGRAMACAPGGSNYTQVTGITHTVDVPTYARFYLRVDDATPSAIMQIFAFRLNATVAVSVEMTAAGKLQLTASGTGIGATATTLSANTWYCVEVSVTIPASGNGACALRLDGVTEVQSSNANVGTNLTPSTHRFGHVTAGETTTTVYIDDVAINDGNGANQNGYPGPGSVVLLKAASDNALGTGWEAPQTTGSDTTGIFAAVANVPPAGVAHSDVDANNAKYIFNAANLGAASNYRANCEPPNTYLPSDAQIVLSQAYMRASCNSTTGTNNMEVQGITPADSAVTCNVETTAIAGTEPSGWKSFRTAVSYLPSLALSDTPVVEATKILTGATRAHMVDQMGLLIEWVEHGSSSPALTGGGTATASGTAARSASPAAHGGGTATASGTAARANVAALHGGGTLTAAGRRGQSATATLTGGGAATASAATGRSSSPALHGAGTLTAAGRRGQSATATLTGVAGHITASGTAARANVAAVHGAGTLTAAGAKEGGGPALSGVAALHGGGALTTAAATARSNSAALPGAAGHITATGRQGRRAACTLTTAGHTTAASSTTRAGAATLSGGGELEVLAGLEAGVGTVAVGIVGRPAATRTAGRSAAFRAGRAATGRQGHAGRGRPVSR